MLPQPVSQAVAGAQRHMPQSIYAAGHPVIFEGTGFTGDARCVLRSDAALGPEKKLVNRRGKWHQFSVKNVTHNWKNGHPSKMTSSDNLCCCVDMHRFLQIIQFCDISESRARCSALLLSEMPMQEAGSGSLSRLR